MDRFHLELFSAREKRAAALIALAVLGVAAGFIAYTRPPTDSAPAAVVTPSPSPAGTAYLQIAPESARSVYAIGGSTGPRSLFHTGDAGRTWQRLESATRNPFLVNVVRVSGDVLLVSGSDLGSRVLPPFDTWRSTDHGAHWTKLVPPVPGRAGNFWFFDRNHGWWSSSEPGFTAAYSTVDGGRNWSRALELDGRVTALNGVALADNRAFTVSTMETVWLLAQPALDASTAPSPLPAPAAPSGAHLFRSTDAGATWQEVSLPSPPRAGAPGERPVYQPPAIAPDGHGFMVTMLMPAPGYRYRVDTGSLVGQKFVAGGLLSTTSDFGSTWTAARPQVGILAAGEDELWSADGTRLEVSDDAGATWRTLPARLPSADVRLGQLYPVDRHDLWSLSVVGGTVDVRSSLLRSTDGGRTWSEVAWPKL